MVSVTWAPHLTPHRVAKLPSILIILRPKHDSHSLEVYNVQTSVVTMELQTNPLGTYICSPNLTLKGPTWTC